MPPEAFNHFINSQVRNMEITTGLRCGPRRRNYYFDVTQHNGEHYAQFGRGQGRVRGRGRGENSSNRGTCRRVIPNSIRNNCHSRPTNWSEGASVVRALITEVPVASGSQQWRGTDKKSDGETTNAGTTVTGTERSFATREPVD